MEFLTVASCLYRVHHNILCGHKGKLRHQVLFNDLGIYHQAVHHVQVQVQDTVHCQKTFRYGKSLVG